MLLFGDMGNLVAEDQRLAPGDRLVLYTDGLTDREGPDGQLYDLERLVRHPREARRSSAGGTAGAAGGGRGVVRAAGGRPTTTRRCWWLESEKALDSRL